MNKNSPFKDGVKTGIGQAIGAKIGVIVISALIMLAAAYFSTGKPGNSSDPENNNPIHKQNGRNGAVE